MAAERRNLEGKNGRWLSWGMRRPPFCDWPRGSFLRHFSDPPSCLMFSTLDAVGRHTCEGINAPILRQPGNQV